MTTGAELLQQLRQMLKAFVGGTDPSIRAANEIEGFLLENFPDDDGFEDLLIALACYRPGGGDNLYDENSIRQVCNDALNEIQSRSSG